MNDGLGHTGIGVMISTILTGVLGLIIWRVKRLTSAMVARSVRTEGRDQWWAEQFVAYLRTQEADVLASISNDTATTRAVVQTKFEELVAEIRRIHEAQTGAILAKIDEQTDALTRRE